MERSDNGHEIEIGQEAGYAGESESIDDQAPEHDEDAEENGHEIPIDDEPGRNEPREEEPGRS